MKIYKPGKLTQMRLGEAAIQAAQIIIDSGEARNLSEAVRLALTLHAAEIKAGSPWPTVLARIFSDIEQSATE